MDMYSDICARYIKGSVVVHLQWLWHCCDLSFTTTKVSTAILNGTHIACTKLTLSMCTNNLLE